MAELAEQLKKTFQDWDEKQSGVIPVEMLQEVLCKLNPSLSERDLSRLLKAIDSEGTGLVNYIDFVDFLTSDTLASVAGSQLPSGTDSDSKVSRIHDCIAKIKDPRPGVKSWMQDMREFLDPHQNPSGYKMCQNAAISAGAAAPLLVLTQKLQGPAVNPLLEKDSDAIRSLAWELLARLCFGSEEAPEEVASQEELLPHMQATLRGAIPPERLSALQLVQALAASAGPKCSGVVPPLLEEVVGLLWHNSFRPLQEAAFDILVSASRGHAPAVAAAVGWPALAKLLDEGEGRPAFLPAAPLQVFLCGRLAVDLLTGTAAPEEPEAAAAREAICRGIGEGRFLGFYIECLEAAVAQREWPLGTEAYHASGRMADLARKLCDLGHARQLVPALAPLARAVEVGIDDAISKAALLALRALAADVACLESLLAMEAFRSETLEVLHKSGDEPEATELLAYLDAVEMEFTAAQSAVDASKAFMHHAPSVRSLAELFARHAALDKEMTSSQVLEVAPEVPLLPSAVKAALGASKFSFKAFAERVYGTPTILGWWPSLMEDAAAHMSELGTLPGMPGLGEMVRIFESAAAGKSSVGAEVILEKVLPAAGLPTESRQGEGEGTDLGALVEAELSELGGGDLDFKALVTWLGSLCKILDSARKEDEAAAAAKASAEGQEAS